MSGVVYIEATKAGTFTIRVSHDEVGTVRRVSGVPTHGEAMIRARTWARTCGYGVIDLSTLEDRAPEKMPDTQIKALIDAEKEAISDVDLDTPRPLADDGVRAVAGDPGEPLPAPPASSSGGAPAPADVHAARSPTEVEAKEAKGLETARAALALIRKDSHA